MLAHKMKRAAGVDVGGVQFVGSTVYAGDGSASTINVSLESLAGGVGIAPEENDVVVVFYGGSSTANRNLSITGYTELADLYYNSSVDDANLGVYYKVMTSTPDTSLDLGATSTNDVIVACVHVWRGIDTTTPIDVTTTTATGVNSADVTPPAITPVTSGAIILAGGVGVGLVGSGASSSTTEGLTSSELSNMANGFRVGGIRRAAGGLGSYEWSSGTFTPATFTENMTDYSLQSSAGASYAAATLALRPAA